MLLPDNGHLLLSLAKKITLSRVFIEENGVNMQIKVSWIIFSLGLIIGGCASIPKESAELSAELTKMIRSAERSHLAMLDLFIADRKQRANEYVDSVWTPKFIAKTVQNTKILELLKQQTTDVEKVNLLSEFSQDAASTIAERKAKMMDAIESINNDLRQRITEHYNDMLTVNMALTANIRSAADVSESRAKLLESFKIDTKSLLPLDKISGILDSVTNFEGKVEETKTYIEQASELLKEK